jgi:hypothetical protein
MYSNPALSWQGVAIGDPLYRPFKVGLDAQLKESLGHSFSAYLCLRQINRLQAAGQADVALTYARAQFIRQPSLPLAYKLAKLYEDRGEAKQALEALNLVRYVTALSSDEVVLVKEIADFLNRHGDSRLALDVYTKLIERKGQGKALRIALLEGGARIATSTGQAALASAWRLAAQKLKQPSVKGV